MSPSRTRKPVTRTRPRSELFVAIAGGAAVLGGTLLLIWLLRPGPPGVPGTGGLMSRQPRVSLLIVGTGCALALAVWWVVRRYRARRISRRAALISTVLVVIIAAVLLGIFWPGGLVRDYPSLVQVPNEPTTPVTNAPGAATTTPAPATTGVAPTAPSTPTTKGG